MTMALCELYTSLRVPVISPKMPWNLELLRM